MKILNSLKRKPIRKTYKFLVYLSWPKQNNESSLIVDLIYWKTKGEVVQTIRNSNKYFLYKILSISLE